ncbi:hypothetical protein KI387_033275 [Taxus chinensis]|uniref:TIR domain-containing protein n=1 Tax=Taxus chinensis TaxID=29808 RepID=A0AA38C3Y6_TAXCH|nr:hypothetical protein KI387_033275 [Taxus chinensis]
MVDENRFDSSIRPYDVFINHRGPDVKKTLASNIHYSLQNKGLNVFFDKTEFKPGQKLVSTIKEAIRTSSVHIAILSPGYATSRWCLDELCLMVESKAYIIPVFYRITPEDLTLLQCGKGVYANAFKNHEQKVDRGRRRYDSDKLEKWREALKKIRNYSGLELDSDIFNGDEGELLKKLVARVMEQVIEKRKKPIDALDYAVKTFDFFLSESRKECPSVLVVGIVGASGSGKTTLAVEFYNRQEDNFDRCSFLLGVSKASRRNGLKTLQSQLLKDLTCDEVKIYNVSKGKEMLEHRVNCLTQNKSCKFLIVIDDIDNRDQMDALLLRKDLLGSGSLVIVTSCDKSILKLSKISFLYKMKPLDTAHAQELLCREAFHQDKPIPGFDKVVETALSKCGGLPLFLKLLGEHLYLYGNNSKEYWKRKLEMISDIGDILKMSYYALEEEEQQIFLDIACFFEGMEKNSAIRIWDGLGWRGAWALQKLEYMCLIEINKDNLLKMEEVHSNLGREIADQQLITSPDLPCRLWRANEVTEFLEGLLPMPKHIKIRGITDGTISNHRRFGRKRLTPYTVSSVTIELLEVDGDLPDDIFGDRLRGLVWFRWKNCPRSSITLLEMSNLRVLELVRGNFTTLCDPSFELPTQLREVRVKTCSKFVRLPQNIDSLKLLEKITLNGSVELAELPEEFCKLKALIHLELRQCEALTSLPDGFGELSNLQYVDFSDCQNLSELPDSFGQLSQLRYLNLRNCINLIIQPDIFGGIRYLEQLSFENCLNLRQLPTQTSRQEFLRILNLLGTSLDELPDDIGVLTNLQVMYVESPFLTSTPTSLENMPCLSEFVLFKCTQLTRYPTFPHLSLSYAPHLPTEDIKTEDLKTLYVYGTISDPNVNDYLDITHGSAGRHR